MWDYGFHHRKVVIVTIENDEEMILEDQIELESMSVFRAELLQKHQTNRRVQPQRTCGIGSMETMLKNP